MQKGVWCLSGVRIKGKVEIHLEYYTWNIQNKKLLFVQFQILNWRWRQDIVFYCHGYEHGPRDLRFFIINSSTSEMKSRTSIALFTYLQDFLSLLKQFNRKLFSFFSHGSIKKHCVNIDKYNLWCKDAVFKPIVKTALWIASCLILMDHTCTHPYSW